MAGNGSYILRPCGHDLHGPTVLMVNFKIISVNCILWAMWISYTDGYKFKSITTVSIFVIVFTEFRYKLLGKTPLILFDRVILEQIHVYLVFHAPVKGSSHV